jgi:U2 small nuclear ribonucleoprotein A'
MRLDAELLARTPSHLNALKDRELDLRGKLHLPSSPPPSFPTHLPSPSRSQDPVRTSSILTPTYAVADWVNTRRAIENLGVTRDALDSIDLTDNSITTLSNFPLLRRLQHLLLASNPIRIISPSLPTSLPNLRTLILTNCAVPKEGLGALGEVLGKCRKLETLSLKGCEVAQERYYKEWILFKCSKLRSLDYERVKEKVRPPSLAYVSELMVEWGE